MQSLGNIEKVVNQKKWLRQAVKTQERERERAPNFNFMSMFLKMSDSADLISFLPL